MDATFDSNSNVDSIGPTPKRSNASITSCENSTMISGFVFCQQNGAAIVEALSTTPRAETGSFHYKISSSTPLPILTGPAADAPRTKAVVLPGTVEEISLRVCPNVTEADSEAWFLRLSHRRGWIADRVLAARQNRQKNKKLQTIAVVQEVQLPAHSVVVCSDNHSIDDGGSSVWSGATGTTSLSTTVVAKRRHRPPRRRKDASSSKESGALPRQVAGKVAIKPSVLKSNDSIAHERVGGGVPSSNVSVLSDDSSLDHSRYVKQQQQPSSPDASLSTNKSVGSASHQQQQQGSSSSPLVSFYLMRVTAPRGLKILDAPHFQVNNLIRSGKQQQQTNVSSSYTVSQMESPSKHQHHSIFQTMSGRLGTTSPSQKSGNPAVFDASSKTRLLPRGAVFEAATRVEATGAYSQGAGLIKLSDNSGWAVVPRQSELDQQYRNFTGGAAGVKEGEATRAYEEIGSAVLETNSSSNSNVSTSDYFDSHRRNTTWLRVMARAGVVVCCPPPPAAPENDDATSPTSSRGSSALTGSNHGATNPFQSNESDIASSVGSGFLDAMFRTPKKKDAAEFSQEPAPSRPTNSDRLPQSNTIPCGMLVEVDRWADPPANGEAATRQFARLVGGQGWVPLTVAGGKPTTARSSRPESRFGSFWYRVQPSRGLRVRLGPSRRAPSIKSEDGVHFRFECGEFLRASEIVTVFSDAGTPVESFAKLYRNRHVRLHIGSDDFRSLASLTTQAEWVQVYSEDELFLEECATEPRIERHKQGWRYNVVPEDGVAVRKGPSFAAEKTGIILFGGESVVINERVTPAGDKITWLRMKDGQGWIHDVDDEGNDTMIAHSLRHRAQTTRPRKPTVSKEGNEVAYNTIIARLFHNEDGSYQPPKNLNAAQGLGR